MTKELITQYMLEQMNEVNLSWVKRQNFTHVVTLAFNRPTTLNAGRASLRKFHARLDRALLGPKFFKKPKIERSFFYAFPEKINSNFHYNMLLRVNADYVDKTTAIIAEKWSKVVISGSVDVKLVTNAYDYDGLLHYQTKEQTYNRTSYQSYILSSEFLSE
jgi:hypothetical protein